VVRNRPFGPRGRRALRANIRRHAQRVSNLTGKRFADLPLELLFAAEPVLGSAESVAVVVERSSRIAWRKGGPHEAVRDLHRSLAVVQQSNCPRRRLSSAHLGRTKWAGTCMGLRFGRGPSTPGRSSRSAFHGITRWHRAILTGAISVGISAIAISAIYGGGTALLAGGAFLPGFVCWRGG